MGLLDKVFPWLGHGRYESSPVAVATDQVKALLIDSLGRLRVVVDSTTAPTAAAVSYHDTVEPGDGAEIKATAGTLMSFHAQNDGDSTVYLQIHDSSGVPDPNAVPKMAFRLDPGAMVAWGLENGRPFTNGIYWATSTVPGGYTTVAGSVLLNAVYQ